MSDCPLGVPISEIEDEPWFDEFLLWHRGQTGAICTGQAYNHDLKVYQPTECITSPHSYVVYRYDLDRFLHDWMI